MTSPTIDRFLLTRRIESILNTPQLSELVRIYFSPNIDNPFAGASFDTLGKNPPSKFVYDDLLALNLLDVSLDAEAIRRLTRGEFDQLLTKIPDSASIDELAGQVLADATVLWTEIRKLPNVGRTKASKLLSRKRPHLIPIRDGIINELLGLGDTDWWVILPQVLHELNITQRIEELDPHISGYKPSTLRLLDVAIWMLGSNSRNAKQARASIKVERCNFPIC